MSLNAYHIIYKKRINQVLSREEIFYFIENYTKEIIPDYQASALLMALFLNGMNEEELFYFTKAMIESGETVTIPRENRKIIDKHSTGGVGDKTSFVVSSLLAAYGYGVGKMSGRGLGFTGGTLDKLESIPGFDIMIPNEKFVQQVEEVGLAIIGQTKNLVPADKKLYALRDVTATVDNIPLIASSIMSKKLASDSDGILLDVKVGNGAFMKTLEEARSLAKTMVSLGNKFGRKTIGVLTNMDDPLGFAVGNSLEIKEAIDTLHGKGPEDFTQLCLYLTRIIIKKMEPNLPMDVIENRIFNLIDSGAAFNKFLEFIVAQGGNPEFILNPNLIPLAKKTTQYCAPESGVIFRIDTEKIGLAAVELRAGRKTKEENINHGTGFVFHKKLGEQIHKGEAILTVYYENDLEYEEAMSILETAIHISSSVESFKKKMILEIIE